MGRPPKDPSEVLGKVIPLRLDQRTEARLQEVATRYSMPKSVIIRMITDTFVNQAIDSTGGVQLPPNWEKLIDLETIHRCVKYESTQQKGQMQKQMKKI